ncbi:MAG: hypothetical protein Fur0035_11140 [Anaerolineales bacterium]
MKHFFNRLFALWRGSTLQGIAAIVLPLTLLLVAISFGSFFIHQNAMRGMVGERDERAVRAAASAIESEIKYRIDGLRGLALLAEAGSAENLQRTLADSEYLLGEFDSGLAFFSSDGALLAATGEDSFWRALPAPRETENISLRMVDNKATLLITRSAPGGKISAAGAFSAENLLRAVLEKDFPQDGNAAVYIFDPDFHILYQSGPGTLESDPAQHPGILEALHGQSGATYMQTGTDEHVLAYSPIRVVGWAIIIEESWQAVSNPTLQTSQITPLILVPALLLAVLALWFGAEQIVKPLRALEARAAKLAWGDFKEIEQPVQGIAEIRHLQAELAHMARRVQAAQQNLHSYIGAITQGQEDERQRLARELHDDTIQTLIALKQRAQMTRRALPAGASPQPLAELETLTEQSIENLRRTIRALRPIYLEDLGLAAALEILANEAGQNSGLRVSFQSRGRERRLTPEAELALYRMAQEALNNALRHSRAAHFSIQLEFLERAVKIQVADNGIGFDLPKSPAEFVPAGHFGLVGLYERAQLIGAELEIISAPGAGTRVLISLPAAP